MVVVTQNGKEIKAGEIKLPDKTKELIASIIDNQ
jgi:hypothetical protein|nr:MAG TPA: hypothetical protein [Bacteriophage sp.]